MVEYMSFFVHGPLSRSIQTLGLIQSQDDSSRKSLIPTPSLPTQLAVFTRHSSLRSPSRLNCFQHLLLDLLLLRAGLTHHGDKDRGALELLSQLMSAPGHRVAQAKFANFLNVGWSQMISPIGSGLIHAREIIDAGTRGSLFGADRFPSIVGRQEFIRGVINRWGT